MRALNILFAAALISTSSLAAADSLPTTWDGLVEVKSKKMEFVYLLPNADFRPYTKIQYDPVQISLRKDWLRNYNDPTAGFSSQLTNADVRTGITTASAAFNKYFGQEFAKAGYTVVSAPGADVLHVSVSVMNVEVSAPDTQASIGMTFTADAGQGALVVEARDSLTNQLLGRAIDRQLAGDTGSAMRTRASNLGDFEEMFQDWAKVSVQGLAELKSQSPIDTSGMKKR